MATGLIEGALVGDAVSKLSDVVIHVIKKTAQFKSNLIQLQQTLTTIKPIFNEIEKLNKVLDRPKQETYLFIAQLEGAEALVRKCEHIKWNLFKKYTHSCKLEDLNRSLLRFFQIDVQLQQARDVKDVLVVVKDVQKRMKNQRSGGSSSSVPLLKGIVIGFDERLGDLKAILLKDSGVEDCSVVVVSAAGGCGKTTFVTMLCHDPVIQEKFGEYIYFVTVSNTPNIKVIVNNLLQKSQAGQQLHFTSDEDAIHQWGSFIGAKKSEILLVLDDVWSDSIINDFKFKLPGYTILVTSRFTFTQFETYKLQPLNHSDATTLFRHSAFSECGSKRTDIPDDLVDKLVKSCKKHPLALCVIGGALKGTHKAIWEGTLSKLTEGQQSVLDLNKDILLRLTKSLDVLDETSVIKQCFLDLGLFPEDQNIAATSLMNMWVHLYKHDEWGLATLNNLFELSFKNLTTLLPIRNDSTMVANYCEEQAVMQHDMMRELAIHLSSQEPIEQRKRLIINAHGEELPDWTKKLQQTLHARLLSISTDERFASIWNEIQVPEVEVFVLNFMSKTYTFPPFMAKMDSLKVLIVTNYGFYFTELDNIPAPNHLSSLTSIKLQHISISSISNSILELVNLQKLSLIMCKIGLSFDKHIPDKLPNLLEIDISHCQDLFIFPLGLCNLVNLKKLSITYCHELISLSESFGSLTNLEILRLKSCTNLKNLPKSIINLQKLSVIDISYCFHLLKLPEQIGKMRCLRIIHMKGCTGMIELPSSVKDLRPLEVVCDEETSYKWNGFSDVKLNVVEEDKFGNLLKIVSTDLVF